MRPSPLTLLSAARRLGIQFAAEPLNLETLGSRIQQHIMKSGSDTSDSLVDVDQVVSALTACSKLEHQLREASSPNSDQPQIHDAQSAHKLIKSIIESPNVALTTDTLKSYLTTAPFPSSAAAILVINQFNFDNDPVSKFKARNNPDKTFKPNVKPDPNAYIPRELALVPFRRAAYHTEFDNALELMDITVGRYSLFQRYVQKQIRKVTGLWALSTASIMGGVQALLTSGLVGVWENPLMIQAMVFTYISSVTLYGVLSMSGRVSRSGEVLEWAKGTMTTYRYKHGAEMQMASLLAQINMGLVENQGECSLHMIKQLQDRRMEVITPEQEEMLREYWARGGEGFEWIEPDQDPAEIIWRHKMDLAKPQRIGSPYSRAHETDNWTDKVIHTLPHASLMDTGPKELPQN